MHISQPFVLITGNQKFGERLWREKRVNRYSGIGGQAVLEGVMMKNQEKYAVAVRKPNGEIAVELENYQGLLHGSKIKEIPFIRGIFNFIDSLVLGMKCLNYSASFYEEDEEEEKLNKAADKVSGGHGGKADDNPYHCDFPGVCNRDFCGAALLSGIPAEGVSAQ